MSNKKSNPIFPIYPIFFRLSDSTTLMKTIATTGDDRVIKVTTTISTIMIQIKTDKKKIISLGITKEQNILQVLQIFDKTIAAPII